MFSLCDSHQYKFLNQPLKWTEAQKICRQKYIDLASINGVEDVVMLLNAVDSNYTGEAFIGLYFKYNSWQWSLTDSEFYKVGETEFRQWGEGQPNNGGGNEYCVLMSSDGKWSDYPCSNLWYFMCYNGKYQFPFLYNHKEQLINQCLKQLHIYRICILKETYF
ncbi:LYAM1 protein, partial [Atractosteus spatula]|nr:LYAM1 protein [Atractosteus spatula]